MDEGLAWPSTLDNKGIARSTSTPSQCQSISVFTAKVWRMSCRRGRRRRTSRLDPGTCYQLGECVIGAAGRKLVAGEADEKGRRRRPRGELLVELSIAGQRRERATLRGTSRSGDRLWGWTTRHELPKSTSPGRRVRFAEADPLTDSSPIKTS